MVRCFPTCLLLVPALAASGVPTLASWATDWTNIQICGQPVPDTPLPCIGAAGANITDPSVCNHLRCCWVPVPSPPQWPVSACVAPWSPPYDDPTRAELDALTFFGGDQSMASLSNLRGGLEPTANDAVGVTSVGFAPFFSAVASLAISR